MVLKRKNTWLLTFVYSAMRVFNSSRLTTCVPQFIILTLVKVCYQDIPRCSTDKLKVHGSSVLVSCDKLDIVLAAFNWLLEPSQNINIVTLACPFNVPTFHTMLPSAADKYGSAGCRPRC